MEISVEPIRLTNREAFRACKDVLTAVRKFEAVGSDADSDALYEARFEIHDAFKVLCEKTGIDPDAVTEGDFEAVLSILQTGEAPAGKTTAAKSAT